MVEKCELNRNFWIKMVKYGKGKNIKTEFIVYGGSHNICSFKYFNEAKKLAEFLEWAVKHKDKLVRPVTIEEPRQYQDFLVHDGERVCLFTDYHECRRAVQFINGE